MKILVSGSLAYDRIMDFPGRFSDHIVPEKVHTINISLTVNSMVEKFGGTAGWAKGSTFTVSSGSETTYVGSVGNINGDNFPADTYSWGMFTYAQRDLDSGKKFEVINYWVE